MRKFLAILNTQIHHHLPREDHGWHHQPEVPASGLLAQLHSDLSPESGSLRRLRGLRTQTLQAILSNFLSVPAVLAVLGSTLLYIQTDLYLSLFISIYLHFSHLISACSTCLLFLLRLNSHSLLLFKFRHGLERQPKHQDEPKGTCFTAAHGPVFHSGHPRITQPQRIWVGVVC